MTPCDVRAGVDSSLEWSCAQNAHAKKRELSVPSSGWNEEALVLIKGTNDKNQEAHYD